MVKKKSRKSRCVTEYATVDTHPLLGPAEVKNVLEATSKSVQTQTYLKNTQKPRMFLNGTSAYLISPIVPMFVSIHYTALH